MSSSIAWALWPAPVPSAQNFQRQKLVLAPVASTVLIVGAAIPAIITGLIKVGGVPLSPLWNVLPIVVLLAAVIFVFPRHRTLQFLPDQLRAFGGAVRGARVPWDELGQVALWLVQERAPDGRPQGDAKWVLSVYDQQGGHRYSVQEGFPVRETMLFQAMDAMPTPNRRVFLIEMPHGAERWAPPENLEEWERTARGQPMPEKVRSLLDAGPRPGLWRN